MFEKIIRKKAEKVFRDGLKERIFLQAGLARANAMKTIDTLFVGSSYAMYGIISSRWNNSLNLGGSSQDIFYAKKIVDEIKTEIKRVIFICGYYTPYTDLSLEKNERKILIGSVYLPIFGDSHNWKGEDIMPLSHWHREYRYPNCFRRFCEKQLFNYFYENNAWYDDIVKRDGDFSLLSLDKRINIAIERTNFHNRHIKHKESFVENLSLMSNFKEIIDRKGMELYIVIPPFTKEYLDRIDERYIEDFYMFCEKTGLRKKIVDCNELLNYDANLFIDADHLNDAGAVRFTDDLKKLLEK